MPTNKRPPSRAVPRDLLTGAPINPRDPSTKVVPTPWYQPTREEIGRTSTPVHLPPPERPAQIAPIAPIEPLAAAPATATATQMPQPRNDLLRLSAKAIRAVQEFSLLIAWIDEHAEELAQVKPWYAV